MQILFLGAPGAGKGTQCKRLSVHLALPHLSSGDLLREVVKQGTPAGKLANGYMVKGNLVPDDVLIAMFREKFSQPECSKGFILDGFPRNLAQANSLDELLNDLDRSLTVVINMQLDMSKLLDRITGRRTCPNKACNSVYHIKYMPPKKENVCDACGGELVHRPDDKEDVVANRLKVYERETAPLVDYYDSKLLLRTIDGDGDADEIFSDILKTIKVLA